jgi:hypothetical protein
LAVGGLRGRALRAPSGDVFSTAPLDLRFAQQKTLDPRVTFTRASSGTFIGSDGLLKTATTNEPRFDHNPTTGESLGLLAEEARTNLLQRSEEFNDASWSKGFSAITANQGVAPDGNSTADKFAENTSNAYHQVSQSFSPAVSTVYTYSLYAKAAGRNLLVIAFNGTAVTGSQVYCYFNLANGTVGSNFGTTSPSIVSVGNGWYRCSVTTTTLSSAGTASAFLTTSQDSGLTLYVGDGTSGYLLWGAMLEAGAFPTSYIPTTTATVTRAADVASITGSNFSSWYNATAGTMYAEVSTVTSLDAGRAFIGNQTNYYLYRHIAGSAAIFDGTNLLLGSALSNPGAANKLAMCYGSSTQSLSTNGSSAVSGTSTNFTGSTLLTIGGPRGVGTETNGTIRRLTYWPIKFANTQLQQITQP